MGEVVNLRSARKRVQKQRDDSRAATNRVRFGRSKSERAVESARAAKVTRDLDQRRIETGDER